MTYLLDTHAISNLMRGDPGIEHWLDVRHEDDRIVTSRDKDFTAIDGLSVDTF